MRRIISIVSLLLVIGVIHMLWEEGMETAQAETGVKVMIDGKTVDFADQAPQIIGGRLFVPVRPMFEAMGAHVLWDSENRIIRSELYRENQGLVVTMKLDSPFIQKMYIHPSTGTSYYLNWLDTYAQIVDNRTMIPLRASGEAFGYTVYWDGEQGVATLLSTGELQPQISRNQYEADGEILALHHHELELFMRINQKRVDQGLEPLILFPSLSEAAQARAGEFITYDYFDPQSRAYRNDKELVAAYGHSPKELMTKHFSILSTPSAVMEMIEEGVSSVLNPEMDGIGIGYMEGGRLLRYWTVFWIGQ